MRVLFCTPRPNLGGASQVLLNLLAERRHQQRFQCAFLFSESGPALMDYAQYGPTYISPMQTRSTPGKLIRAVCPLLHRTFVALHTRWVFSRERPDLIYINTVSDNFVSRAMLRSGVPLLVHVHEMDFLVATRISDRWVTELLGRARLAIMCSQATLDFYQTCYGVDERRLVVLRGPVSVRRFGLLSESSLRERLGISDQTFIVGMVGNPSFVKGVDVFVKAAAIVVQHQPQVQFLWLGMPTKHTEPPVIVKAAMRLAEQLGVRESLRFLPQTSAVRDFLEGIDVLAVPSRTETLGLVILEAYLCRKPVVAMAVGGIPEIVDAETGWLVRDRTPSGLAEGILSLMADEGRRREAGECGKVRVLEKYEAGAVINEWLQLLGDVVKEDDRMSVHFGDTQT